MSPLTIHECDLLVLSGTDFPYDKFLPTKPKIAQVDIRVDNLGRRSKLDLPLWGDVRETIRALLPMLDVKSDRSFLDSMLGKHKEALRRLNVYVNHVGKRTPMHPEPVAAALSKQLSPEKKDVRFPNRVSYQTRWNTAWTTPHRSSSRFRRKFVTISGKSDPSTRCSPRRGVSAVLLRAMLQQRRVSLRLKSTSIL